MEDNNQSNQPERENNNNNRRPYRRNFEERKKDPSNKERYSRKDKDSEKQGHHEKGRSERPSQARRGGPNFTHFFSLPLNTTEFKLTAKGFTVSINLPIPFLINSKDKILSQVSSNLHKYFDLQGLNTIHITLSMLSLENDQLKQLAVTILKEKEPEILQIIGSDPFHINFDNVSAFYYRESQNRIPRVIYLSLKKDESTMKLNKICHLLISEMMDKGIVKKSDFGRMCVEHNQETNLYTPQNYHVTLFRVKIHEDLYGVNFQEIFQSCQQTDVVTHHVKRIDISTRFSYDGEGFYRPLSQFLIN